MIPAEGTNDVDGSPCGERGRSAAVTLVVLCTHHTQGKGRKIQHMNDVIVSEITAHGLDNTCMHGHAWSPLKIMFYSTSAYDIETMTTASQTDLLGP